MNQNELALFSGMMCVVAGVVVVGLLAIMIFYLLTLHKALTQVSPRNRLMEPGMVWLSIVPCVRLIWPFFIAIQVPGSLRNEFRDRDMDDGSDYGKSLALSQAILGVVSSVIANVGQFMERQVLIATFIFSLVLSLVGLVLFILFWVKIATYTNQLAMDGGDRRKFDRGYDDYDDDDVRDYPRRGPSGPSPDTFKEGDAGRYK